MDKKTEKHESYAMLDISRVNSSGGEALFGSSILHNNTVRIRINEASVDRHLNRDWVYSGKEYIEIEMSQSQFAEAITSMNTSGVPCTLRRLNGRRIETCPFTNKRMEFEKEFENQMTDIAKSLKELTEKSESLLSEKKPPTKADKEAILHGIKMLRQEVESNIPFIQQSFNEQMDKTVKEAKGEVEGFILHKVVSAGLQGLQKELELLGNNSEN